jgi:hypothetical protein
MHYIQSNFLITRRLFVIVKSLSLCSCNENRRIQEEHDQEMAELQKSWLALRHSLRHVYDSESNALTGANDQKTNEKTDDEMNKLKELVER